MDKKVKSTLLLLCLVLSCVPVLFFSLPKEEIKATQIAPIKIDLDALASVYGERIPVVVSFNRDLSTSFLNIITSLNLKFSLGSASESHIGPYYLMTGSSENLQALIDMGAVAEIAAQTHAQFLESPRDLSIPEINADNVNAMLDDLSRNITGQGILVADLDSGVDWKHPDLWFADGGQYSWFDQISNGQLDNGTDGIDVDSDGTIMADEALYFLDLDNNGVFNVRKEWVWMDNVTQNAYPDTGEPFFVVNDTSSNGLLDLGEQLVMLKTPKTKYIFEKDGSSTPSIQMWERGTNLTTSTHTDDSPYGGGHGTAVSGILLGGQLDYRDYVGVASDAELLMIRVIGNQNTWLTIEEGLTIANNTGADVILTEVGSWTWEYLDGSSKVEQMIDELVADGIPVISPSGNLGGKNKHAMATTVPNTPHLIDFSVPKPDNITFFEYIYEVYITVLTIDPTDFLTSNFSLWINGTTIYLHPGLGEWAWFVEPNIIPGVNVQSFTSISMRGTRMLAIKLYGSLPNTALVPYYRLNISTPDSATIHAYISDIQTGWSGGCIWINDVVDSYQITWPSTADRTISVASYRTRNLVGGGIIGDRADFSSRGPRIDGVNKQNVAAPGGYDIISDYAYGSAWVSWYNDYGTLPFGKQFGSYRLFSGTSASGPHVAGAAALLLQANSSVGDQMQVILETTATSDVYTGAVPNADWGGGKLDVEAALISLVPGPDVSGPVIGNHDRTPFTPKSTESVLVNVTVTDASGVDTVILSYFNGTMWFNLTMTWLGSYYEATIPALPDGTIVYYRFYANDTLGNWSVSGTYSYTVTDLTTTTTTGPTTTSTTSPTTGGPTSTVPPPEEPDYLRLAILLTAVLGLIILAIVCSRRKPRREL